MDATQSLVSAGRLAADSQHSVDRIIRVANELGIIATLEINGVKHFDKDSVERITKHLRGEQRPETEAR